MKLRPLPTACAVVQILAFVSIAGSYGPEPFTSYPAGTTSLGDGTTIASNNNIAEVSGSGNRYLRMTRNNTGNTSSSFKFPDLDAGKEIEAFTITFDLLIGGSGTFADGGLAQLRCDPGWQRRRRGRVRDGRWSDHRLGHLQQWGGMHRR